MDISAFICDLLYEHDCIIIPGFGGFICAYKPSVIDTANNTISPPSKSISFNINLQSNDGLLINYIAQRNNISFQTAQEIVQTWSLSAKSLLKSDRELTLKHIGIFTVTQSGNIEFAPNDTINYLKSSFGLKVIEAAPIVRQAQIELAELPEIRTISYKKKSGVWRIAAALLLIGAISGLAGMMWAGVDIKPLNLNEASVANFMGHIYNPDRTVALKTIPIPVQADAANNTALNNNSNAQPTVATTETAAPISTVKTETVTATSQNIVSQTQPGNYYVITGVFAEEKNVEAAKTRIRQKFPDVALLVERSNHLTRVGYVAGTNYTEAKNELTKAQEENPAFWLLKK
jgi:hypothetical protein